MADHTTSNVIPFGGRESNLTTAMLQDAVAILSVCRDRLIDHVEAVFTRHIGRASDELLAMADRATSQDHQQICFAAMQFLANRAPALLQQFRKTYVGSFDASLATLTTVQPRTLPGIPDELKLVDDEDFEQDLAITKLTTRAAFNCSQQLVALDRRLAALLRVQRVTQEDNPLHPGVLYTSMFQALSAMDVGSQLALTLVQSFERHTAAELPGIYAEINRYLAESGILPTIPLTSTQAATGEGGGAGARGVGTGMSAGTVGGALMGASAGPLGQIQGEDVFTQLLRAFQSLASAQAARPPGWFGSATAAMADGAPTMPFGSLPGLVGPPPQPFGSQQLIQALGDLQRGSVDPASMPGLGTIRVDPHGVNALSQIRATPMASWSPPVDAMTMDIVSMLFEAVFNDPDLPATVRAEIAKLQIPVLKVALLDKSFFSDRRHPARRLLDAIANAGLGRGEQDEPRLLEKIRTVVTEIVDGFEADVRIFASQVEGLERFLADEESRVRDKAAGMADELARRERKEVAASRVAAEVEPRLNRRQVPPLIAGFIGRNWRLVLAEIFIRVGDADPEWAESLRLMDELIWSVEPKASAAERDRLVVLLPDLLKRLRAGLARVELEDAWDGFFSDLIQLHMAALRKDAAPDSPVATRSSIAAEAEPSSPIGLDKPSAPEPAPAPKPAAPHPDDHYTGLVQALEVGAWVEFQSLRGSRNTLRLSWVSDLKRVYLFTNRQGENAMTLAATSLADHLRKGTARLLSQNPLTERAVAQVIERVMPASGEPGAGSRPPGYAWEQTPTPR